MLHGRRLKMPDFITGFAFGTVLGSIMVSIHELIMLQKINKSINDDDGYDELYQLNKKA